MWIWTTHKGTKYYGSPIIGVRTDIYLRGNLRLWIHYYTHVSEVNDLGVHGEIRIRRAGCCSDMHFKILRNGWAMW
jgi:hypothetical protein